MTLDLKDALFLRMAELVYGWRHLVPLEWDAACAEIEADVLRIVDEINNPTPTEPEA